MKIAVIGSGIAGLSAAWSLSQQHDVTLFEKSAHLGMDAHSLDIDLGEGQARVDVPLRVFFDGFYPNLTALYNELGIEFSPINYSASFGDLNGRTYFHYHNYRLGALSVPFLKGRQSLNRTAFRIGLDCLRFFRRLGLEIVRGIDDELTLEDFLDARGYSRSFARRFLFPAFAGICTCSHESMKTYPAKTVLEYLNSGLLFSSVQRVTDGTQAVVDALADGVQSVRLNTPVHEVGVSHTGARVRVQGDTIEFDHVVLATQANQAIKLLTEPSEIERSVLSAFRYEPSRVIVHRDVRLAPSGGVREWAPVNFLLAEETSTPMATIWLNAIQALPSARPVFQSWNPIVQPNPDLVLGEAAFERPVLDTGTLRARRKLDELHRESDRRVWFCGSYASQGIPLLESAASSAFAVAERFGCNRPWAGKSPT